MLFRFTSLIRTVIGTPDTAVALPSVVNCAVWGMMFRWKIASPPGKSALLAASGGAENYRSRIVQAFAPPPTASGRRCLTGLLPQW